MDFMGSVSSYIRACMCTGMQLCSSRCRKSVEWSSKEKQGGEEMLLKGTGRGWL